MPFWLIISTSSTSKGTVSPKRDGFSAVWSALFPSYAFNCSQHNSTTRTGCATMCLNGPHPCLGWCWSQLPPWHGDWVISTSRSYCWWAFASFWGQQSSWLSQLRIFKPKPSSNCNNLWSFAMTSWQKSCIGGLPICPHPDPCGAILPTSFSSFTPLLRAVRVEHHQFSLYI